MLVLLVEDEALIREIMAESLQDAGYSVREAADGQAALQAIADAPTEFGILVTDFHMPGGVDGMTVATAAREASPHLPVIIASGRPDVLQAYWSSDQNIRLLRKPYLPSVLVSAVQAMTGGPALAT